MRLSESPRPIVGFVHPPNYGVTTGNLATALRWQGIVEGLGCASFLCAGGDGFEACWDLAMGEGRQSKGEEVVMVALNGVKCHREMVNFRRRWPKGKAFLILAVTGTDMNGDERAVFEQSLDLADRIVVLQDKAFEKLPSRYQAQAVTLFQSVGATTASSAPPTGPGREGQGVQVCVVGHLREVKDPMRCAKAMRLLPPSSSLVLKHAGAILDAEFADAVAREERENPRYQYLGELTANQAQELIGASDLLVVSSLSEGGPLVVAEAVMADTPVLSSRIDGVIGMLGEDYPGYYTTGDEQALGALLRRFEEDGEFRDSLRGALRKRALQFAPERERTQWAELLAAAMANG